MNAEGFKIIKFERYILAVIMTAVMFLFAQISGQKEVIFPEILAIMTGAWVAKRQPWSVNKRKMFLLICLSSVFGVAIVKYVQVSLFFQVFICFVLTGISLLATKTNFIPIISACILPVYLQTSTWIYSLAVCTMAVLIVLIQWLMEKYHIRAKNHYSSADFNLKEESKRWLKLFVVFALISLIPLESKNIFFLAPPLIVTYAEFANPKSPLRKKPWNIYFVLLSASFVGVLFKIIFELYLHLPLVLVATLACICLFLIFDCTRTFFPPAGAILLLPMILSPVDLLFFPLEVLIGASIVIPVSMILFKEKTPVS